LKLGGRFVEGRGKKKVSGGKRESKSTGPAAKKEI